LILDTTAIIDLLRGDNEVVNKIKGLERKNIPLVITSISVFEIWQGTKDIIDKEKMERIYSLLESLGGLSFDMPAAEEAGSIHSHLKKEGKIIDPEDSMIAGIAKIHHETILTRNIKHFQRIFGLKLESY